MRKPESIRRSEIIIYACIAASAMVSLIDHTSASPFSSVLFWAAGTLSSNKPAARLKAG